MEPVGYSGLDNRKGAFKMAIKKVNGLVPLMDISGITAGIVDVTDRRSQVRKDHAGARNTWTIQMTLHDNIMVTGLRSRALARERSDKPNDEGVLIWDISDPINPRQLSHWKTGSTGRTELHGRQVLTYPRLRWVTARIFW